MDHSLAIRKDPERVWDVPGSETGSRRDRGRVHHRMSFRKRRQLRYAEELLRILEATLGICAVMMIIPIHKDPVPISMTAQIPNAASRIRSNSSAYRSCLLFLKLIR